MTIDRAGRTPIWVHRIVRIIHIIISDQQKMKPSVYVGIWITHNNNYYYNYHRRYLPAQIVRSPSLFLRKLNCIYSQFNNGPSRDFDKFTIIIEN